MYLIPLLHILNIVPVQHVGGDVYGILQSLLWLLPLKCSLCALQ